MRANMATQLSTGDIDVELLLRAKEEEVLLQEAELRRLMAAYLQGSASAPTKEEGLMKEERLEAAQEHSFQSHGANVYTDEGDKENFAPPLRKSERKQRQMFDFHKDLVHVLATHRDLLSSPPGIDNLVAIEDDAQNAKRARSQSSGGANEFFPAVAASSSGPSRTVNAKEMMEPVSSADSMYTGDANRPRSFSTNATCSSSSSSSSASKSRLGANPIKQQPENPLWEMSKRQIAEACKKLVSEHQARQVEKVMGQNGDAHAEDEDHLSDCCDQLESSKCDKQICDLHGTQHGSIANVAEQEGVQGLHSVPENDDLERSEDNIVLEDVFPPTEAAVDLSTNNGREQGTIQILPADTDLLSLLEQFPETLGALEEEEPHLVEALRTDREKIYQLQSTTDASQSEREHRVLEERRVGSTCKSYPPAPLEESRDEEPQIFLEPRGVSPADNLRGRRLDVRRPDETKTVEVLSESEQVLKQQNVDVQLKSMNELRKKRASPRYPVELHDLSLRGGGTAGSARNTTATSPDTSWQDHSVTIAERRTESRLQPVVEDDIEDEFAPVLFEQSTQKRSKSTTAAFSGGVAVADFSAQAALEESRASITDVLAQLEPLSSETRKRESKSVVDDSCTENEVTKRQVRQRLQDLTNQLRDLRKGKGPHGSSSKHAPLEGEQVTAMIAALRKELSNISVLMASSSSTGMENCHVQVASSKAGTSKTSQIALEPPASETSSASYIGGITPSSSSSRLPFAEDSEDEASRRVAQAHAKEKDARLHHQRETSRSFGFVPRKRSELLASPPSKFGRPEANRRAVGVDPRRAWPSDQGGASGQDHTQHGSVRVFPQPLQIRRGQQDEAINPLVQQQPRRRTQSAEDKFNTATQTKRQILRMSVRECRKGGQRVATSGGVVVRILRGGGASSATDSAKGDETKKMKPQRSARDLQRPQTAAHTGKKSSASKANKKAPTSARPSAHTGTLGTSSREGSKTSLVAPALSAGSVAQFPRGNAAGGSTASREQVFTSRGAAIDRAERPFATRNIVNAPPSNGKPGHVSTTSTKNLFPSSVRTSSKESAGSEKMQKHNFNVFAKPRSSPRDEEKHSIWTIAPKPGSTRRSDPTTNKPSSKRTGTVTQRSETVSTTDCFKSNTSKSSTDAGAAEPATRSLAPRLAGPGGPRAAVERIPKKKSAKAPLSPVLLVLPSGEEKAITTPRTATASNALTSGAYLGSSPPPRKHPNRLLKSTAPLVVETSIVFEKKKPKKSLTDTIAALDKSATAPPPQGTSQELQSASAAPPAEVKNVGDEEHDDEDPAGSKEEQEHSVSLSQLIAGNLDFSQGKINDCACYPGSCSQKPVVHADTPVSIV
ncbi:unnamed protein product [Amoebophrya sp. A120]|nr:unnamed protein product [Amoebophrya sp. A120]|eukprot:GSA120T00003044001.1